jgi:hypothetical protein
VARKKLTQRSPHYGKNSLGTIKEEEFKCAEEISEILKSNETHHKKKAVLFSWLKDLGVGWKTTIQKIQRLNSFTIKQTFYTWLARWSIKEYKKKLLRFSAKISIFDILKHG